LRRFLIICGLLLGIASTCLADEYDAELSKLKTVRQTYQQLRVNPNLTAARMISPKDVDQTVRLCGEIDASAAKLESILHRAKQQGMTPQLQTERSAEEAHFQSLINQFQSTANHLQEAAKHLNPAALP
jgi:hypothetical protein